jgi:hypothetical protein
MWQKLSIIPKYYGTIEISQRFKIVTACLLVAAKLSNNCAFSGNTPVIPKRTKML